MPGRVLMPEGSRGTGPPKREGAFRNTRGRVCSPCGNGLEQGRGPLKVSAMALSEKVRRLAESYAELSQEEQLEFLSQVTAEDDAHLSAEWTAELRSRADDIDSGRVKLIDGEEVLRRLRAI